MSICPIKKYEENDCFLFNIFNLQKYSLSNDYRVCKAKFITGVRNVITWELQVGFREKPEYAQKKSHDLEVFLLGTTKSSDPIRKVETNIYLLHERSYEKLLKSKVHRNSDNNTELRISVMQRAFTDLFEENIENSFIIRIRVKGSTYTVNTVPNTVTLKDEEPISDIASLYGDEEFSDVIIRTKNIDFPVHKCILAARSPVFAAMFWHDMKGKNDNVINVEDGDSGIFEKMLRYIYTNKVDDLDNIYLDLLPLADKYQLPGLNEMCIKSLSKNITMDNIFQVFVTAKAHNIEQLYKHSKSFIDAHIVDIMKSPEYEALGKDDKDTALSIVRSYFKNRE